MSEIRIEGADSVPAQPMLVVPNRVNLRGIVVTLVPFSVASVILALASLDYLGFGLPDSYASWGRLLNDGLSKLSSPWIVSSAFMALVGTLLIVTFIGESIREATDPRRHSYYE